MGSMNISEACYDNVASHIGCTFSYDGNNFHIILNYTLLILNFIFWFKSIAKTIELSKVQEREQQEGRQNRSLYIYDYDDYEVIPRLTNYYYFFALSAWVLMIPVQICLCLILDCVGVFVLWCSLDGWIMRDLMRRIRQENEREMKFLLFCFGLTVVDSVVIIYYFFVDGPVVSAVRVCSLFVGSILSQLSLQVISHYFPVVKIENHADTTADAASLSVENNGVESLSLESSVRTISSKNTDDDEEQPQILKNKECEENDVEDPTSNNDDNGFSV